MNLRLLDSKDTLSEKEVNRRKMLESSYTHTQKQIMTSLEHFDLAIPEGKYSCTLTAQANKSPPLFFVCLSQLSLSFVTERFVTITSLIYLDCYKLFHVSFYFNSQNIPNNYIWKKKEWVIYFHTSHRAEHCFFNFQTTAPSTTVRHLTDFLSTC